MSVDNVTEKIFDNFKKITPALVAVAILTGLILFLPDSILKRMSLDDLPILWNRFIGIAFLLSVALTLVILAFSLITPMADKLKERRFRKNQCEKISKLSPSQLNILRSKKKSFRLDCNSGDTLYLQNESFIYRPAQTVSMSLDDVIELEYVPHTWLLDLYNEQPDLFQ